MTLDAFPRPLSAAVDERSPARPTTYDVAIVGGSVVGLVLACALQRAGISVAVIEAQPLAVGAARQQAYAFSLTSARIFAGLGLWSAIAPELTRFSAVQLSDGDSPQRAVCTPQDLGAEALYYAAEHPTLMRALQAAVTRSPDLTLWCPAQVQHILPQAERTDLWVEESGTRYRLSAKLVVAADGARSALRQQVGLSTFGWRYWQSCLTVTVRPASPHRHIAYEKFQPSGPFAILPISENRCQVVWTAPHAEAEALLNLDRPAFMAELQRRYGSQDGELTLLTEPRLFPVRLMQSRGYVHPRFALVGDAAHCCHPVGGQGLNMGIRDAAALAEVITTAVRQGEDWGSLTVLRRYQRWRSPENLLILAFTDVLDRLFSNQFGPIVVVRRWSLWLLQTVKPLRYLALRLMTGQFGRVPRLGRSPVPDRTPADLRSR